MDSETNKDGTKPNSKKQNQENYLGVSNLPACRPVA
jgi:hypothetical protein